MRKILSLLMAVLFAGSLMAAVGEVFYSFVPYKPSSGAVSDYTQTGTMTIEGLKWTVPGNWYGNGVLRLGGKGISAVDRSVIGQDAIGDAIAKIVVTHNGVTSDNITLNSLKVTVASDADFTQNVVDITAVNGTDFTVAKSTAGTIEITPNGADFWAKDSYYKFAFNLTNTNTGTNYAFVLNKIEFYSYKDNSGCTNLVAITKGEEANGTFSLSATEVCGDGEGEDVLVTAITPAEGYEFSEITTSASGTVDNEGKKVTGITAATTIFVVFNEIPKYTVSFSTGEGNPTVASVSEIIGGAGVELPAGPAPVCSDWAFAGWATAAVVNETTKAPELLKAGANYKPAEDVTLYAVYKRSESGEMAKQDITETFEGQEAGTVYNDTLDFAADESVAGLAWTMYYGTVSTNDKIAGSNSAQMRWYASAADVLGCIETKTALGGLDSVLFKMRVSNLAVKAALWYSTDGENWTLVDDTYACDATGSGGVKTFKAVIDGSPDKKYFVRIGVSSKGTAPSSSSYKLILDDIQFYYEDAAITSYYLSAPTCGDTPATPKMQIAGAWNVENEAWVLNDMTLAQDKLTATYKVQLAAGNYNFKMLKDGNWLSIATSDGSPYTFHRDWTGAAGITDNASNDLKIEADEDGEYIFTWIFANDSLNIAFPAKREPLADGFYLIGQNGWDIKALNNDLLFVVHKEDGDWKEYKLTANLELGQKVKVARVENDEIKEYFPDGGEETNFTIDETFAGQRDIYFSAVINNSVDWARFGGYFWMGANTVQIDVTLPEGISWDDVYAYVWKMVEEKSVNWLAWPGLAALEAVGSSSAPARIAMQKAEGNKYFFDCPVGYNYVVFNNNNDQQSVDLNWSEAKKSFVLSAEKDGEGHYKEKDSATALGNIDVTIEAVKALENGQLIIIKNGVKYNVQGAVVR